MIENFITQFTDNSLAWRYVNFPAFMLMLQQKALFFPSVELLRSQDPYEGTMPPSTSFLFSDGEGEGIATLNTQNAEILNRRMFVNCWHVAEYESAAMWKLYSGDTGIAIQSSVASLRSAFPPEEQVNVHAVAYVNFNAHYMMERARFCKRKSFDYERELRLVVVDQTRQGESGLQNGKSVPVDLERLIERVGISPVAQLWFCDVVKTELQRHGLGSKPVNQSSLYDPNMLL